MDKKHRHFEEWLEDACKYVVTGDSLFLQTAINKSPDPYIRTFLESDNLTHARQVFPNEYQPLLESLSNASRQDEKAMIEILGRRFVALATREIATYPEKERHFIFNTFGLRKNNCSWFIKIII